MAPETAGAAVAGLIAGITIGWNASKTHGANDEVKSNKAKIPRYRKARFRSGITTIAVAVLAVAVLASLGHK